MAKNCFVIQPFKEPYLKRYDDIYAPAITESGLTPLRVDLNPGAKNLIEDIERGIKESELCFADISSDNPNIWYELGYAFAIGKNVVMTCEMGRRDHFPFDISHKHIIQYKAESPTDFNQLKSDIISKINAFKNDIKTQERILESPLQNVNGLKPYESTLLAFIIGDQKMDNQYSPINWLSEKMERAGFTDTATSIAFRLLQKKGFIESSFQPNEYDGEPYAACHLTTKGVEFVLNNVDLFDLTQDLPKQIPDQPFPF